MKFHLMSAALDLGQGRCRDANVPRNLARNGPSFDWCRL